MGKNITDTIQNYSGLKCKICGNDLNNELIIVRERHLGLGDEFEYFLCSECRCLQINNIPVNMDRYYPQEYYSFQEAKFPSKLNWFNYYLKKSLVSYYTGYSDLTGFLLSLFFEHPFSWIRKKEIDFDTKILDVGSGSGRKLLSLQRSGFKNLTGIDPYLAGDIYYEKGLKVLKKNISEIDEKFDFITLHHSFEHMQNPYEVVKHINRLLNYDGCALIRIPVSDSYAFRKYREYWVAFDAPRHIFLHSPRSMELLLKETDLIVDEIIYDSTILQFTGSEKYLKNLPFSASDSIFTKEEIRKYSKETKKLNKNKEGDCACFYLKKIRN